LALNVQNPQTTSYSLELYLGEKQRYEQVALSATNMRTIKERKREMKKTLASINKKLSN